MAKVGISNLHYAVMSTEDTVSANPVYGTIKKPTAGLISVDVTVNSTTADLYADNILWEHESSFQNAEMKADIADFPMDMQADLLGHNFDSETKTLKENANDQAPYVAVGFEFAMTKGKKLAVWMLKGKFSAPNVTGQTKGENTEYGTNEFSGTFSALKGAGTNTGNWKISREFDANASTDSFFASVPLDAVNP